MCNNPFFIVKVTPEFRAACYAIGYQLPRLKAPSQGLYSQLFLSFSDFEFLVSRGVSQRFFVRAACGKCLGCKSDYAAQWQTRILLESSQYESNLFVTLTYDDEHIYRKPVINPITGETRLVNDLVYRDVQLFMKKLRKHFTGERIRYFVRGEYGDRTARTHYHIILFNCRLPDLKFKFRKNKADYFTSELLEQLWSRGQCLVARLDPASARYVSSYSIKEKPVIKTDLELSARRLQIYERDSFNPFDLVEIGELKAPFCRRSSRPGLARDFYDKNKLKIYHYDRIPNIKNIKHVRYFDRLLKQSDPLYYAWISYLRARLQSARFRQSSLTEREELIQREERLRARAAKKCRDTFSSP